MAVKAVPTQGIIPTRVGTSTSCKTYSWHSKDHPHACGDKVAIFEFAYNDVGSSPRVWGQDADRLYQYDRIRIIPTRVGTSVTDTDSTRTDKDHPHACGDKYTHLYTVSAMLGSSPRVWGQGVRDTELC